jgi:hypothetical protein
MNDIGELLSINAIREKLFKRKSMYNPNLIANLSKEAYDIYLIRKSIHENLVRFMGDKDIHANKVVDFINDQIKKCKNQLKKAQKDIDIKSIKTKIDEWEEFL